MRRESSHGSDDESDAVLSGILLLSCREKSCLHLPKNLLREEGGEVGRRNRKMGTNVKLRVEWQEEKVKME